MHIKDRNTPHRGLLARVVDFLEYLLVFVIIAECNSMFASVQMADMNTSMPTLFYTLAIALAAALVALHALKDPLAAKRLRGYMAFWLLLVGYAAAFYVLNVRRVTPARQQNYIRNFLVLVPLLTMLFKLKQQRGEGLDLLYKHADIMCVVAALSLVVYLTSIFHVDGMLSDPIYTKWSGGGSVKEHINLLNVSQLIVTQKWQLSNIEILRNYGFFVEPLMFSIPLITAISTELFLRKRADLGHIYRAILLSATLLSANSTIGVMLLAGVLGLKVLSTGIRTGRRWLAVLVVCAMVGACALLFLAKKDVKYEATEVTGNSIGDHIEDIRAGLKAFLHRPLLGGGYNYEACIREFMSPTKVVRNPGLSNSVATVLGEGGLMLGALCMLPFLICFGCFFRKESQDMALWAVGPLGLYIGIIFVYHMYLMFIIAFGYSLVEMKRAEYRGFPWRLGLVDLDPAVEVVAVRQRRRRALSLAGAAILVGTLFVWLGVPVCNAMHRFLRAHQFSMSQSPVKAFGFGVTVLFHGVCIRRAVRREIGWKRLLALVVWDAIYLLVYPRLYSDVATILAARNSTGGRLECAALLGVYFVGGVAVLEWPLAVKRPIVKSAAAICVAAACAAVAFLATQAYINRLAPLDSQLADALDGLVEAASGKVYASESPALYRRANGRVAWPATGVSGFEGCENASIVYRKDENRWELFEHGFEVAELTDDRIVYSNDESVISKLTGQGVHFYRYYPFDQDIDLYTLARENSLEMTDEGAIRVGGEGGSLESGPSDVLRKGQYTVNYWLHIDPDSLRDVPDDTLVCSLVITGFNGRYNLALKEVMAGAFDADGDATLDLPFKLGYFCGNTEYRALGQTEYPLEVQGMALRETPAYISTIDYNCYRNPIRIAYYNVDGSPYYQAAGYAALEQEYNAGGAVKAIRYFDADMRPMLIRGGYAEVRYGYNRKWSRDYEAYFDTEGKPMRIRAGYAAIRTEYDPFGNATAIRYLDVDGKLMLLSAGYAEIHRAYDDKKQLVYEAYYGTEGERVLLDDGYSAVAQEYDAAGNVAVRRYLGTDDTPVSNADGVAETHYAYDAIGRVCHEEYFDEQGLRTLNRSGISILDMEYDEAGNVVRERYCGTDGLPAANASGYAELRRAFDSKGRVTSLYYFGVDGGPTLSGDGCYGMLREYDGKGNVTRIDYVDADGNPMESKNEIATLIREYDENRNIILEWYLGVDGGPVAKKSGIAEIRREFNGLNRNVRELYFDVEGGRTVSTSGYSGIEREYDEQGNNTGVTYIGLDDRPTENSAGVAIIRREYDAARNCVAEYYLDAQGNPTENKSGVAEIRRVFDEGRNLLSEEKLDLMGNSR